MHNSIYRRVLLFISTLFSSAVSFATTGINMPYGVTPTSREIYNLHMAGFYVCCGIGVVVFSVLIYSLIKFRKSKGAQAALFHEHVGIEIAWTIIPTIILIALAIPATIVLKHIHNTDESGVTIKVTGYQWKWKYEYLDQGISFFSNLSTTQDQINNITPKNEWFLLEVDNEVVVPVNTKVKLLITADDVIHAWWVPELGVKQDAIPGFINENWFTATQVGTYRGQCGELCGVNHGFMPIVVKVVPRAEFDQWVVAHHKGGMGPAMLAPPDATAAVKAVAPVNMSEKDLLAAGKAQYDKSCAMCHQPTGLGLPPTFPALKGSLVTTGPLAKEVDILLHGVKGTAMQAFGEQLDDQALAGVITYTRQSWGNDLLNKKLKNPTVVQPQDIAKAR